MSDNVKVMCSGCGCMYPISETPFYRRKRWCGNQLCKDIINAKVKHSNYKKQQKKIEKGTFRSGVNAELRDYIKKRDKNKCQRCKLNAGEAHLQVHHILPVANGGTDDKENLILLCSTCHTKVHQDGYRRYIKKFVKYSRSAEQFA